eukprot:gene10017-20853_t
MKLVSILLVYCLLECVLSKAIGSLSSGLQQINSHSKFVRTEKPSANVVGPNLDRKDFHSALVGSSDVHDHGMSMPTLVLNMIADLCPHGMLPLAYGFAQGGPTGLYVAMFLLVTFGATSGYTMVSLGEMSDATGAGTFGELWARLINPKTKWVADASIFALCFGCCVFYSAFIGDIFGALSNAMGATGILAKRAVVLGIISITTLLPLCLVEDLSGLQFSSLLGVVGIIFTVAVHAKRLMDGSYASGSSLLASMPANKMPHWPSPKFNNWNINRDTLVLVNMLCVGFLAHYNAISYYKELKNRTVARYRQAVSIGFTITITVFTSMMFMGYLLFGSSSLPLLLNNFHRSQDGLATGARIATGMAIIFAYPLMFAGLKSAMFKLLPHSIVSSDNGRKQAIMTTLLAISSIAFKCGEEDVSIVLGIVGSVLGCGVAYIIPAMLRLSWYRERKAAKLTNGRVSVIANHLMVLFGVLFAVLGVWITLATANQHHG